MKKITLLAILFLIAGSVNAQTYFNGDRADLNSFYISKWEFEVDGVLSNVTGSTNFSTGAIPGVAAGVNLSIPILYPFSVVPSLLYAQKGYTANTVYGKYTQRSQFIDMPILAKFTTKVLDIYVGPLLSYQVSTKNNFSSDFPANVRSHYTYGSAKLAYQAVVGLGFEIDRTVSLRARYSFDITGRNINGNPYLPAYRAQALQVGVAFNILEN